MKQTPGQMTIFDFIGSGRPCDYKFTRYIGQRVREMIGAYPGKIHHGIIDEIKEYYTIIKTDDHRILAGTPYNVTPEEKEAEQCRD